MKKPTRPASHVEFEQYSKPGSGGRAAGYDPRAAVVTPGYVGAPPSYRDARDAALAGQGVRSLYPDEALGAVRSNIRSYSRGVHVGERLNPASYLWPEEFNPQTGLALESKGLKWAPSDEDPVVMAGGANITAEVPMAAEINPERSAILGRLLPNWR